MREQPKFPELAAALAELADQDNTIAPPPELRARIQARLDSPTPVWRRPSGVWFRAVAVVLIPVACFLVYKWRPEPRAIEPPFVQIPFVGPPALYERTEVVRQSVPIAALIAAGFEVHVADSGRSLPADVLVGQDGRALAIRLVREPALESKRRIN
jgi:hypothetical protein